MMLHDKTLKTILIEKIRNKVTSISLVTQEQYIYFDKPIGKYKGVKLHHTYPFLFESEDVITYYRGVHGGIIKESLEKFKLRKYYVRKTVEGRTFKVRPK